MINLQAAGLSETEAKSYETLLNNVDWQPTKLAKVVQQTRTNMYKILDRLVALGLAERFDKDKKLHYRATNPSRLLELAHNLRTTRENAEKKLELHVQELTREFIKTNEQPGIRFYQGEKELKEIYFDQIKTKKPIYIIRPDYNMDLYDFDYMTEIRHMARKAGIERYAITPDRKKAPKNYKESDPYMILQRTWMKAGDYSAPVEWNAYGDKLAVLSFGNEALGMIIESPQIAESFKQLYILLERGLKRDPDYDSLPQHAEFIGATG